MRPWILLSLAMLMSGLHLNAKADPSASCNDLLLGPIHELAKLRLDLDQRLVRGEADPVTRMLQEQYTQKEIEILAAGKLSRDVLISKVKSEVASLQDQETAGDRQRVEVQKDQRQGVEDATTKIIPLGKLKQPRKNHTQSTLLDGKVMILGGSDHRVFNNEIEVFNPKTRKTRVIGTLKEGRSDHFQATLSDGHVVVSGGNAGYFFPLNSIELIDPKTGISETIGHWSEEKREKYPQSLLDDDKILISGGDGNGNQAFGSIEVFDLHTKELKTIGELAEPRDEHTQTVLLDGRVLVAGGFGQSILPAYEIIDPATGKTKVLGLMKEHRRLHAQGRLPDGRVILAGGQQGGVTYRTSIEIFDPTTEESEIIGHTIEARTRPSLLVLSQDLVLIGGGTVFNSNGVHTRSRSFELFNLKTKESEVYEGFYPDNSSMGLLADGQVLFTGGVGGPKRELLKLIQLLHVGRE